MLHERERWVLFCDITLKSSPEEAPFMGMGESVGSLLQRQQAGDSFKLLDNNTAAIRVTDMRLDIDNQIVYMLIQYADKSVSDPAFGKLETGELRVEPKLEGEGIALSAHMAISLIPKEPRSNVYLTLLENIPGITKSRISPFLTSEFKYSCAFRFRDENNQGRSCRPLVEIYPHASQTLREELQRGRLLNIELINFSHNEHQFDEMGFTSELSRHIKLKMSRPYEGDEALSVIDQVRLNAKQKGYGELRIKYKRYEGKQVTVPIETARENAADQLFSKMELIRFQQPLPQCLDSMEGKMIDIMTRYILEARPN